MGHTNSQFADPGGGLAHSSVPVGSPTGVPIAPVRSSGGE